MNQIRKDYLTDDRVLIATIRSSRPKGIPEEMTEKPDFQCPFCPGNEKNLAPAKLVYLKDETGKVSTKTETDNNRESSWLIKVLDNKFPVLDSSTPPKTVEEKDLSYTIPFGFHELVIDTPQHNNYFHVMNAEHVKLLFQVYKERLTALSNDERIQFISISKNHGPKSGGTILHPHSHVIASNFIPTRVSKELSALNTADACLMEVVLNKERNSPRIILEQQYVIVISPFAAVYPYEVWIIPKSHACNLTKLTEDELNELALVLRDMCRAFECILNHPSYNFIVNQTIREDKYHMYIRLFPRFYFETGFEISLNLPVNEVTPEKAAEELRRFFGG